MPRVLIVTNDFPPRLGGIESFVKALADRFAPEDLVVYTSSEKGAAEYDATLPFPVFRDKTRMLLPTKRVRSEAIRIMQEQHCDRVLIGSSAPLGLMAQDLKDAGAKHVLAISHGHEVWWAKLPISRGLMRKIGDRVDTLTYISGWCRDAIGRSLSNAGRAKMVRMAPGVDSSRFEPGIGGAEVRARHGLSNNTPLVLCGARLIKRKGQDQLIKAWPLVIAQIPTAKLMIVGDGPQREYLHKLTAKLELGDSVIFAGPKTWEEMPAYFDACDVFAMPSRDRRGGLEVEGLGIVFIEAASCEKPVIVGRSGGAPDTVEDGVTGFVVNPTDSSDIAARITYLLSNPEKAREMGKIGRTRALDGWQWDHIANICKENIGYPTKRA